MMSLRPIGIIRSPFKQAAGTPIQARFGESAEGTVELDEGYEQALLDLEGFDRVWLIYWLDRADAYRPVIVPYLDDQPHGLFATRSPCRPNPIGLSAVRLLGRDGRVLRIAELDVLDNTPLLDLKPYVAEFDAFPGAQAGWIGQQRTKRLEGCPGPGAAPPSGAPLGAPAGPAEELVLELDASCIETAAKKTRERLVCLCLAEHGSAQEAPRAIELLGDFLAQTDFRALRTSDPALCGHEPCRVLVYRKKDGAVGWKKLPPD